MSRILVVDDHAPNREYLVSLLGYGGHEVSESADGAEALEDVRRERPDLVIADILMPTMDGYEFVRRLRNEPVVNDIPVVFYTAVYHEHEAWRLAESCGVAHVLRKPCEPEVVLNTVKEALGSRLSHPPVPDEETFRREHYRVVADKLSETIDELGIANERFGALIDINLKLASERDPRVLLQELCPAARNLIGARYAFLAVGKRDTPDSKHLVSAGMDPGVADGSELPRMDQGLVGKAYRERRSLRIENSGGDPGAIGLPAGHPPVRSVLVAPIVSLKHVYGWICLGDRIGTGGFGDEDESLLTILAAQVGRIYENGSLYTEVQESEHKFRQITEHINEVFFLVDPALTRVFYISPAYEEIWGRRIEDLYGNPGEWMSSVRSEDKDLTQAAMEEARTTGRFDHQYRIRRPDDETRWIHARGFPIRDEDGRIYRIAGIAEDITARKLAEERVQRLNRVSAVLSGINSTIVRIRDRQALFEEACRILTEHGRFAMAWVGLLDQASRRVTPSAWRGPAPDYELVSKTEFSADQHLPGGNSAVGKAIRRRQPVSSVDLASEGGPHPGELSRRGYRKVIALPLTRETECQGVVVLYSKEPGVFDVEETALLVELAGDISFALDYIRNEERVEYLAYHDPLTGLANRTALYQELSRTIEHADSSRCACALLLMNINNFRDINETLGHGNGDLLLKETARRVAGALWERDLVACLGGDEFAVLLPALSDKRDIERVVSKISYALQKQFVVQGLPINVEARLGVALYPDHGDTPDLLWQHADIALRDAKEQHRPWRTYEPAINHYDPTRLALIGGLRKAMDHNELVLHYQPRIDLETGHTLGVEALLRWQHPDRGMIYPDDFIPFAERTGLINPLTTWVLANAMRQGHVWHKNALPVDVSVNISARNLLDPNLVGDILDLASSSGFHTAKLRLEITESAIMSDPEGARKVLQMLSDAGIGLAVDDFGIGYSSLAYIRDLPVSTIKIDKSFVINFDHPRNAAIVSTAIDLGHNLGLTVTAEGVENEATCKVLREMGCDVAQGYYFTKPLPVDQVTTWLRGSRWPCISG